MGSTPNHIVFTRANKGPLRIWELRDQSVPPEPCDPEKRFSKGQMQQKSHVSIHVDTISRLKGPLYLELHTGPGSGSLERSVLTAVHPVWSQGPFPPILPTPSLLSSRSQPTGFPLRSLQGPGFPSTDNRPVWDHLKLYCHQTPWVWLWFCLFFFFHAVYSTQHSCCRLRPKDVLTQQFHSTTTAFEEQCQPNSFLPVSNPNSNLIERATSRHYRVQGLRAQALGPSWSFGFKSQLCHLVAVMLDKLVGISMSWFQNIQTMDLLIKHVI